MTSETMIIVGLAALSLVCIYIWCVGGIDRLSEAEIPEENDDEQGKLPKD